MKQKLQSPYSSVVKEFKVMKQKLQSPYSSVYLLFKRFQKRFFSLLECILPEELHEEFLGDLKEKCAQMLDADAPYWKIFLCILRDGFGQIQASLFLPKDWLAKVLPEEWRGELEALRNTWRGKGQSKDWIELKTSIHILDMLKAHIQIKVENAKFFKKSTVARRNTNI